MAAPTATAAAFGPVQQSNNSMRQQRPRGDAQAEAEADLAKAVAVSAAISAASTTCLASDVGVQTKLAKLSVRSH